METSIQVLINSHGNTKWYDVAMRLVCRNNRKVHQPQNMPKRDDLRCLVMCNLDERRHHFGMSRVTLAVGTPRVTQRIVVMVVVGVELVVCSENMISDICRRLDEGIHSVSSVH